jgi:cell division septal protein FtsQ
MPFPNAMRNVFQVLLGFAMIVALIAVQLLVLYAISRLVLIAVSFVPMIGKRHRHKDWSRLNRP